MTGGIPEERAEGLVNMFLDDRLQDANEPPGLREAVTDRVSGRADDIGKRGGQQIGHLRSPSSRRIPDAYLADEEVIENEFQTAAAGIRIEAWHLRPRLALSGALFRDAHQAVLDVADLAGDA